MWWLINRLEVHAPNWKQGNRDVPISWPPSGKRIPLVGVDESVEARLRRGGATEINLQSIR